MQHVRTSPEGASAAGACLTKVHTLHLTVMLKIPAGYVSVYRGDPPSAVPASLCQPSSHLACLSPLQHPQPSEAALTLGASSG